MTVVGGLMGMLWMWMDGWERVVMLRQLINWNLNLAKRKLGFSVSRALLGG
jgi:hypothetical protein